MSRYKTDKSTETRAPFGIGLAGTYEKVEIKDAKTGNIGKGFDSESRSKAEAAAWKELQSKNESSSGGSSSGSSGGCYLTTACMKARGLGDNCDELQILRKFRDNFLLTTENGREAVKTYYKLAPSIVNRISDMEDSQMVWESIYKDIDAAIKLIYDGKYNEAFQLYEEMTMELEAKPGRSKINEVNAVTCAKTKH
ncbi:MAG: hypothetical protein HOP34_01100 [Methylococcaceae bacterium]|nr:hypothetical protein [Methylococcaceae bacterium]